jgi:hypothetical protein
MAIFATNIATISAAEVNQSPVTTEEFKEIIAPDDFTLPEEFSTVNVTEFNEKKVMNLLR